MDLASTRKSTNRFVKQIKERDGVGLFYETGSGETGVVWLVQPSVPGDPNSQRLTILGRYLQETGQQPCM